MSDDAEERWEATAAAVAHELGTPLTVAQAALQALEPAVEGDDQWQMLLDAAQRSLRSIELQVSRLQRLEGSSAADLAMQRVDLSQLAGRLVADLDPLLLDDHPTSLRTPGEVHVDVDPDQIRQVLYNLLSNAAKYSPPGREIVLSIERTEDQVVLLVRDQGHGVAPEDAERIFEKYERADSGTPGAGLGLYLARLIVEAHGGALNLRPAEGEGAIFELRLPSVRSDA